jgi:hypothetical protein
MAPLRRAWHVHIRTTPKGDCGIVLCCIAHKMPIVDFVQTGGRKGVPRAPLIRASAPARAMQTSRSKDMITDGTDERYQARRGDANNHGTIQNASVRSSSWCGHRSGGFSLFLLFLQSSSRGASCYQSVTLGAAKPCSSTICSVANISKGLTLQFAELWRCCKDGADGDLRKICARAKHKAAERGAANTAPALSTTLG